jgi:3-oxoacyl-[acyl-carrier-protein] synthase-3
MNTYSKIVGTGSYFPPTVVTNFDFEKIMDTSDEWIRTRTGISERRYSDDETTSDMAYKASKSALEMSGIKPESLDGIIVATFSPDTTMPSTACILQGKLGIKGSFAFDIAAACTGFIYAVGVADSMIKSGLAKNLLVVGAERLSPMLDFTDRGTAILFGDGAGAVVMTASDTPGVRSVHMHADGTKHALLSIPALGTNYLAAREIINPDGSKEFPLTARPSEQLVEVMDLEKNLLFMKGNDVFKIAVRAMADATAMAVDSSGLEYHEIDCFIPHQANLRIIDAAAKRINLTSDKVVVTLDKYGNTSSATIPTALDIVLREGRVKEGSNIVCAAFGGGLTWGSLLFTL